MWWIGADGVKAVQLKVKVVNVSETVICDLKESCSWEVSSRSPIFPHHFMEKETQAQSG